MKRLFYAANLYVLWDDATWTLERVVIRVDVDKNLQEVDDHLIASLAEEQFIIDRGVVDFVHTSLSDWHLIEE